MEPGVVRRSSSIASLPPTPPITRPTIAPAAVPASTLQATTAALRRIAPGGVSIATASVIE